jgi:hypothetical protein
VQRPAVPVVALEDGEARLRRLEEEVGEPLPRDGDGDLRVPAGRLIDWRAGDGWEPICAALDLPVPQTPFPHENKTITPLCPGTRSAQRMTIGRRTRTKPQHVQGFCAMELGGLEPPTSWVRSRRSPN